MKSRFVILIVFAFLMTQAGFSQQPKLKFDNLVHDFGTINETDGRVQHTFICTNTSNDTLKINRVNSSKHYAKAEWSNKKILPGGTSYVKVSFIPKDQEGKFKTPINITTTESGFPVQQVFITGTVNPRQKTYVDYYPKNIGNLRFYKTHLAIDNLKKHESRIDSFLIYNEWDKPMTLSIENVPAYMNIEIIPEVLEPSKSGVIRVSFDASKSTTWGLSYNFYKLITNDTLTPRKNITVGANVVEDFSTMTAEERKNSPTITFDKKTHNFGQINQGDLAEYNFEFSNTGKEDLIIRRTKAACGCTSTKMEKTVLKPGESSKVNIVFNSRGYKGKKRKSITVISNDPDHSVVMLFIEMDVLTQ